MICDDNGHVFEEILTTVGKFECQNCGVIKSKNAVEVIVK